MKCKIKNLFTTNELTAMTKYLNVAQFIKKGNLPVRCKLGDSVAMAKTLMLLNDFSQLPVLNFEDKIIGSISWKSIGKVESTSNKKEFVDDCLEKVVILNENDSFLESIKLIAQNEYILVSNSENKLTGIITTYDMTMFYNDFMFPYVKLGIIEDGIRNLITKRIKAELNKDITEFTFGKYVELFKKDENWNKLGFENLDKTVFVEKLDRIREIRNTIAHYKPKGLTEQEHFEIEAFANIIEKICN